MSFPVFPWHHGRVPDINDKLSIDIWLSQNINWKVISDHHLTTTQLEQWIPSEYRSIANAKYIETIMVGILNDTMSGNEYVKSDTLEIKHVALDFQLEFAEEDFIDGDDTLMFEGKFADIHKKYFTQNPEYFVYDHNIADFDENVANILTMVKSSTVQHIVGFYVDTILTHLISTTNLEGPSLLDKMYNAKKNKYRKVNPRHTVHMLRNMIDALYHLHSKFLVHTNINPLNFRFQRVNSIDLVLIGLESCQTMLPFETLNDHGDFTKFNVKYLSPARVHQGDSPDAGDYTDLTDLWAVGIIAIELLCGISAYGVDATDEKILEKIRARQFPKVPRFEKSHLDDLLKGILCHESTRYTSTECQEHILFDLKRVANLDVPSFLVNALTCSNIDQYKGIIRYAIATRVETLSMDIMQQMGSFFGVRQDREITLNDLKEKLCIEDDEDESQSDILDPEIVNKLKKTMNVFQKDGKFTLFTMLECICFSQCKHMNRLQFVHDILAEF